MVAMSVFLPFLVVCSIVVETEGADFYHPFNPGVKKTVTGRYRFETFLALTSVTPTFCQKFLIYDNKFARSCESNHEVKIMMIAKTIQGKMVDASDYQPIVKSSLYCPGCGGKVIFKKGVKVIAHFAHVSLRDCASFSEGESAEHLAAKVLLKGWMQNAIVEAYLPQLQQRPDLLWGKLAIEVQCSPLSFTRFTERTTQYFVHGYLPWWILGGKLRPHKKWTTFQKACCYYQKTHGLKL